MARAMIVMAYLFWSLCYGPRAVAVWTSDLTLWTHAQQIAPLKGRPFLNRAKAAYPTQALQ